MIPLPDRETLLSIARNTLETYTKEHRILPIEPADYSSELQESLGVFVSLHKKGKLRGCIGRIQSTAPLILQVRDMTIAAAAKDHRFPAVEAAEIDQILIEVSVLSELHPVEDIDQIIPGRHGIYVKKGSQRGTFLPQVAKQTGWNVEELLGHCAKDKAGIGWEGWKDAELFIYESLVFAEAD